MMSPVAAVSPMPSDDGDFCNGQETSVGSGTSVHERDVGLDVVGVLVMRASPSSASVGCRARRLSALLYCLLDTAALRRAEIALGELTGAGVHD